MEGNNTENQIAKEQPVSETKISFWQKKKVPVIICVIVVLLLAVVVIYKQSTRLPQSTIQNQAQNTINPTSNGTNTVTTTQKFDCLGDVACPDLLVQGDPYFSGQFSGYADPSMRKDPTSNRIWMSYSWPTVHQNTGAPQVPAVDIHLAYSDDNGKTWQYSGPLWPSAPDTNKGGDNSPGYDSNEVSNLLPVQTSSGVTWYGIHSTYFVPTQGNFRSRPANSFRLEITAASTPQGLATAPTAVLGNAFTSSSWGIDTRLSALSSDVSACSTLAEPALYFQDSNLYLIVNCLGGSSPSDSDIVVFSTQPTGDIHSWQWKYVGTLLKNSDVSSLGLSGARGFTQGDVAKGTDGQLLLIASPYQAGGTGGINHYGCWVLEIKSDLPLRQDNYWQVSNSIFLYKLTK